MINGLTGRKLVCSRRAQNDAFENMDIREMDQAIILYGNDTAVKKELLMKYDVKYLYWDEFWIQSEYYFDSSGKVVGTFDPLISFKNESIEANLKVNNVSYFIKKDFVDPSLKDDRWPQYDLIFISPENYRTFEEPWNENLNDHLTSVWEYKSGNRTVARLYKVEMN
jgi:hypothetical protein